MIQNRPVELTGKNLNDVRFANRALIFRSIREARLISRAMLAKETGLNPATVTHIVRELVQLGLIEDAGSQGSNGGRPGTLLRIRGQAGYIISIQLDRLYIKGMLTNLSMEEKVQEQVISAAPHHPVDINLALLVQLIQSLITRSEDSQKQILGIGICAPGPLDAAHGVLLGPPNFPGWPEMPLVQIITEKFGYPTFLEQDANACALAEKWFGTTREFEDFIYLLGDGGLGAGLFLNGDIYRGKDNLSGEIGHTTIDMNGPNCPCGNVGCLELYASVNAVEKKICDEISRGKSSLLLEMVGGNLDKITFQAVIHAARQGDRVSIEVLQAMGQALGTGIVNLVNLFGPQAIVIGGQIALAEELIKDIVSERVSRFSLTSKTTPTPVLFSTLRQDAPIIGAFSLVLREFFRDPYLAGAEAVRV